MLAARDEAGQPFGDRVIFGNLMTMLLAGEDTTAYTLAWAVHHLCDSPSSAAALEAELDGALGADPVPRDIDGANRLAYTGAVANEAMRLRPVAPVLFFETLIPTTLGDLDLPVATPVVVLTRPPAVAAKSFHEPDTFRPERWLGGAGGPHDSSAHLPFGSGPRICPGRSLALLEMKVVLALLYKSFTVTRVGPAEAVREVFAFTMSPAGLSVRLGRRNVSGA
jgi:cytochrome P450